MILDSYDYIRGQGDAILHESEDQEQTKDNDMSSWQRMTRNVEYALECRIKEETKLENGREKQHSIIQESEDSSRTKNNDYNHKKKQSLKKKKKGKDEDKNKACRKIQ